MSDRKLHVARDRAELALTGFIEILRRFDPKASGAGVMSRDGKGEEGQDWVILYSRPVKDYDPC